jgi:hypothetical protein
MSQQLDSFLRYIFHEKFWLEFNLQMACPWGIKGTYDECSPNSNC